MEEQRRNVRSLLLGLLIFVAPMPLDGFIDTQAYFGEEVVLHLQGDRGWTQEQWTDLAVY